VIRWWKDIWHHEVVYLDSDLLVVDLLLIQKLARRRLRWTSWIAEGGRSSTKERQAAEREFQTIETSSGPWRQPGSPGPRF